MQAQNRLKAAQQKTKNMRLKLLPKQQNLQFEPCQNNCFLKQKHHLWSKYKKIQNQHNLIFIMSKDTTQITQYMKN